jgi:hypothetical protein
MRFLAFAWYCSDLFAGYSKALKMLEIEKPLLTKRLFLAMLLRINERQRALMCVIDPDGDHN